MVDDKLVDELKHCGEVLIRLAEALTNGEKTEPTSNADVQEAPKPTMEEIRAAMARKIQVGGSEQIKSLLAKYGAVKLSEIKADDYVALMQDVEGL